MSGFRNFLMRGSLLDLALAVVVGVAFNSLVQALIGGMITPLIAAAGGQHDFSSMGFHFHNSTFRYGMVINAVISFVVIMAVVYYLLVAPATKLMQLAESRKAAAERPCPECLSSIPVAAKRCRFCTAEVTPLAEEIPQQAGSNLRSRITSRRRS